MDIGRYVLAGMTADEKVKAAEALRRMVVEGRAEVAVREVGTVRILAHFPTAS